LTPPQPPWTKSPRQETASTHLSIVASFIGKPADPAHVLVICRYELIDRSLRRRLRGDLPDPLLFSQKLDQSAQGRLAVLATLRRGLTTTTLRQVVS
jgi:hypothetical protein